MFQYGMMRLVDSNKLLAVRLYELKTGAIIDPNNNSFFFALLSKLGGKKATADYYGNGKPFTKKQLSLFSFSISSTRKHI